MIMGESNKICGNITVLEAETLTFLIYETDNILGLLVDSM